MSLLSIRLADHLLDESQNFYTSQAKYICHVKKLEVAKLKNDLFIMA